MGILRLALLSRSRRPRQYHGRASVTSFLTLIVIIILETLLMAAVSTCTQTFYVYWNTTNPIFRIDNTDHIIDVNKGNIPFEYDQVNLICPVYIPDSHEQDAEKYIIYNVSKEEYDSCRITNPLPRIVAICDKPTKLMYFTITFRSFTPQPGGLEFEPGKDYYFISTSSKDDLHRRIGGRCSSDNMKVVFKVCCKPENKNLSTVNRPHSFPGHISTTTKTPEAMVVVVSSSSTGLPSPPPSVRPVPPKEPPATPAHGSKATNKKGDYDKHPNEVVKNEELTYNSAHSSLQVRWCWSLVPPALLVLMYVRR